MTFISIEYFFFLPLIVFLFFISPHKKRWVILLIASYFFYAYWNATFLILIVISTLIDYWAGIQMEKKTNKQERKKYLYASLIVNLGMLAGFKYLSFMNESVRDFLTLFDTNYPIPYFDILLPVGISFYTFQTLSYTIDLYRGSRPAEKHLGMFALYVSYFPQLVAGPIERSTRLLPQLYKKQPFKWENISAGFRLILWGVFKKVIIADYLYSLLMIVYNNVYNYEGVTIIFVFVIGFLWIYSDFSAYTDIAIGSAKLFGVDLMSNFKRPLLARKLSTLWSRWHISLTSWIFNYIYYPFLKKCKTAVGANLLLIGIFLIIGLWHGANWTFVLFGLFHGVFMLIERLLRKRFYFFSNRALRRKGINYIRFFLTFFFTSFTIGLFMVSDSVTTSGNLLSQLFNFKDSHYNFLELILNFGKTNTLIVLMGLLLLGITEYINQKDLKNPFDVIQSRAIRWFIYIFILFFILVFNHRVGEDFFYFQF